MTSFSRELGHIAGERHSSGPRRAGLHFLAMALQESPPECPSFGDRRLSRGYVLSDHSDGHGAVRVVLDGVIKIVERDHDGRDLLLDVRCPGEVLGEVRTPREGPARERLVVAGQAEILSLCEPWLDAWLARDAAAQQAAMRIMSSRIRQQQERSCQLRFGTAMERVSAMILDLDKRVGSGPEGYRNIPHGLSQLELAQLSAISRETYSRIAGDLTRRGVMEQSIRHITLFRPETLRYLTRHIA